VFVKGPNSTGKNNASQRPLIKAMIVREQTDGVEIFRGHMAPSIYDQMPGV
jgi:hypothetical protein